jgi:hypothetical protein
MSAVNPIRAVSPFRFPPSLSVRHEEELRKRGISKEFALASGVRTAADNELRELNFQASLPHDERSKGLQGICFPYVDLELKAEASWRIKPDTTFTLSDGSHPKYLSRLGDKVRAHFPHTTSLDLLADPKVNVVITEGEYKALAIAEALQKTETKRKFLTVDDRRIRCNAGYILARLGDARGLPAVVAELKDKTSDNRKVEVGRNGKRDVEESPIASLSGKSELHCGIVTTKPQWSSDLPWL